MSDLIFPFSRVRHIKRGSRYRVLGLGFLQTGSPIADGANIVVYESEEDSTLWVRPVAEFLDGRFEAAADFGDAADDLDAKHSWGDLA